MNRQQIGSGTSADAVRVLVCGTADWNQSIATNQHYLARELSLAFPVIYTESIGLRRPELRVQDLRRISARLWQEKAPATRRRIPSGVSVRGPRTIPWHRNWSVRYNAWSYGRLVSDFIGAPANKVLWTYTPLVYSIDLAAQPVVYHCVDLLHTIAGISEQLILRNERRLANAGALAVASSAPVAEHLHEMGFSRVLLWNNVADTAPISAAQPGDRVLDRSNKAVFAGNLTPGKIDFGLLRAIVDAGIELHLAGPSTEWSGHGKQDLAELVAAGATYHGLLDYASLADLYWECSVGLIPYHINEYTRGVNPLKMYEYLAAGMSVISTPLPSVPERCGDVSTRSTVDDFVTAVVEAANADISSVDIARRQQIAGANSWTVRGGEARKLVAELALLDGLREDA